MLQKERTYSGYYLDRRTGEKYAFGQVVPGAGEGQDGVLLCNLAMAMFPDWLEPVEILGVGGPGFVWWEDPREGFGLAEFEEHFRPLTHVQLGESAVPCPSHSQRKLYLVYGPGESWIGCALCPGSWRWQDAISEESKMTG